jgi:glycerophosphoryl diester phosphodiesterase
MKGLYSIVCCIGLFLSCSQELAVAQAPHIATIAHRGAGRKMAPENTLAAVRMGLTEGVDILEIDVHQTLDSIVVVSHDETLDRCTNGIGRIDHTTFADIRKLDAGSWFDPKYATEKVPTLEEVLDLVNGKTRLWIELKAGGDYPGIEKRIVDLIHQKHAQGWAEVISFDGNALRKIDALDSTIKTQKLMVSNLTLLPFYMDTGLHWGNPRKFAFVDGFLYHHRFVRKALIRKVHRWGKAVMVWTVNDPKRIEKLKRKGVDGIETDEPSLLVGF